MFPKAKRRAARDEIRRLIDLGLSEIREVTRILELLHGSPDLGNKKDPIDELVYIILSRKTREDAYSTGFDALKGRFRKWDDLLDARPSDVAALVGGGGLGAKKTRSLFGALGALRARFGSCTLRPALRWTNEELEAFLCELPEVSRKTAYCVMMYSMGRQVFPVDTHVGRVLQRVGVFFDLGVDLDGLDHKKLQAVLADLVPPNLRYSLHVNLVVHGRETCRSVSPDCGACELRGLCNHYRREAASVAGASDSPTFIDIFSGGGGMSEGFCRAGYRPLAAVDLDEVALKTLWLNHPALPRENAIARDIREVRASDIKRIVGRRPLDVLVGAPPCQGFSSVGHRSKPRATGYRVLGDDRNYLYQHLVDLALQLRPRLFLMENVPGMNTVKKGDLTFLQDAARRLERGGGYRTSVWELTATALGVPQDRTRCFLVASREGVLPIAPQGEYQDVRRPNFDPDALDSVTLDEALLGIPPVKAGTGTAVEKLGKLDVDERRARRYLLKFGLLRRGAPLIYNHHARYQNDRDLELYSLLRPGENSIDAIGVHGRADLMRYRTDVFTDKYARLRGDRPCKTIVSHLAKDGNGYIHPREVRGITPREAARVQSFRDDYVFCGAPSDQWVQVGNAVPPVVSEAIARSFRRVLGMNKR